MEQGKRSKLIRTQRLEDVPELIQCIQSLLPVKEAARTCILSKTWQHAWSTIPVLRFPKSIWGTKTSQKELKFMNYIDRTFQRYHHENIPIESLLLEINVGNEYMASRAETWIRLVAPKRSLREIYLNIFTGVSSFTLTDELFSGENLNTLSVKVETTTLDSPWISSNLMIKCESLRKLELIYVSITEEVLENLLSTCRLLEEIHLLSYRGLKRIKVKNLPYLCRLEIESRERNDIWEIDGVPNLSFILYNALDRHPMKPLPFKMGSVLGSVKDMHLDGVNIDNTFFAQINTIFPFLESLSLDMWRCLPLRILDITCDSLKSLVLRNCRQTKIQVNAPKLTCLCYDGMYIPRLLVPTKIAPERIKLRLDLECPFDYRFFVGMREMLDLSSKFDIEFKVTQSKDVPLLDLNVHHLREKIWLPATNVEHLSLKYESSSREQVMDLSYLFDVLLLVCHIP